MFMLKVPVPLDMDWDLQVFVNFPESFCGEFQRVQVYLAIFPSRERAIATNPLYLWVV